MDTHENMGVGRAGKEPKDGEEQRSNELRAPQNQTITLSPEYLSEDEEEDDDPLLSPNPDMATLMKRNFFEEEDQVVSRGPTEEEKGKIPGYGKFAAFLQDDEDNAEDSLDEKEDEPHPHEEGEGHSGVRGQDDFGMASDERDEDSDLVRFRKVNVLCEEQEMLSIPVKLDREFLHSAKRGHDFTQAHGKVSTTAPNIRMEDKKEEHQQDEAQMEEARYPSFAQIEEPINSARCHASAQKSIEQRQGRTDPTMRETNMPPSVMGPLPSLQDSMKSNQKELADDEPALTQCIQQGEALLQRLHIVQEKHNSPEVSEEFPVVTSRSEEFPVINSKLAVLVDNPEARERENSLTRPDILDAFGDKAEEVEEDEEEEEGSAIDEEVDGRLHSEPLVDKDIRQVHTGSDTRLEGGNDGDDEGDNVKYDTEDNRADRKGGGDDEDGGPGHKYSGADTGGKVGYKYGGDDGGGHRYCGDDEGGGDKCDSGVLTDFTPSCPVKLPSNTPTICPIASAGLHDADEGDADGSGGGDEDGGGDNEGDDAAVTTASAAADDDDVDTEADAHDVAKTDTAVFIFSDYINDAANVNLRNKANTDASVAKASADVEKAVNVPANDVPKVDAYSDTNVGSRAANAFPDVDKAVVLPANDGANNDADAVASTTDASAYVDDASVFPAYDDANDAAIDDANVDASATNAFADDHNASFVPTSDDANYATKNDANVDSSATNVSADVEISAVVSANYAPTDAIDDDANVSGNGSAALSTPADQPSTLEEKNEPPKNPLEERSCVAAVHRPMGRLVDTGHIMGKIGSVCSPSSKLGREKRARDFAEGQKMLREREDRESQDHGQKQAQEPKQVGGRQRQEQERKQHKRPVQLSQADRMSRLQEGLFLTKEEELVKLGKMIGEYSEGSVRKFRERRMLFEAFQQPKPDEVKPPLSPPRRPLSSSTSAFSLSSVLTRQPSLERIRPSVSVIERARSLEQLSQLQESSVPWHRERDQLQESSMPWHRGHDRDRQWISQTDLEERDRIIVEGDVTLVRRRPSLRPSHSSEALYPRMRDEGSEDEGERVKEGEEEDDEDESSVLHKHNPFFKLRPSLALQPDVARDIRDARERERELRKARKGLYGSMRKRRNSHGHGDKQAHHTESDLQSRGKLDLVWPPPAPVKPSQEPQQLMSPSQKVLLWQRWESGMVNGYQEEDN